MKAKYGKMIRADESFINLVKDMSWSMKLSGDCKNKPGTVFVTKKIAEMLKNKPKVRIEL